ncbi:hypothetical protein ACFPRL_32900 [Pseudoclavibacter helvolus]
MWFWSADVDLPAWGGPFEHAAAELFHFPGGVVFHDVVVFAKSLRFQTAVSPPYW